MSGPVLHPLTKRQVEVYQSSPAHALILVGPTGSGKRTLATSLAETVLRLPVGGFAGHPYTLLLESEDGKSIGIEAVRDLEQFLSLKVPGSKPHDRAIVIENAHLMTVQAQNALLKTLEEPPAGTILILTAGHAQSLLPTIRSRAQAIPVSRLDKTSLQKHFLDEGFAEKSVSRAYAVSGGLPGLMSALLKEDDHPLILATERARQLLSQSAYDRLAAVDELSKQKELAIDVANILQQMAHVSLQTATGPAAKKWQNVLKAGYEASEALRFNAQSKLVLTNLMLKL